MITWEEPAKPVPPVQFKLTYVTSSGTNGDAKDDHLRAAGYVPAAELAETQRKLEAADAELERFRSGLKCKDWVRTGWADAIEYLHNGDFSGALTLEAEMRNRFMLDLSNPLRPEGAPYTPSTSYVEGRSGITIVSAQNRIAAWVVEALGPVIASDAGERVLRFVEEAVELAQACDAEPWMLHRLVDYVFSRPKGACEQEVAGSLVTLLAVASALEVDVESVFDVEQRRIHRPEIIEKVRNRQKEKREALVAAPLVIKGE